MYRLLTPLLCAFSIQSFAAQPPNDVMTFGYSDDDIQSAYRLCREWAEEEGVPSADMSAYVQDCALEQLPVDPNVDVVEHEGNVVVDIN